MNMIFRNDKRTRNIVTALTMRVCLFWVAYHTAADLKLCLAQLNFRVSASEIQGKEPAESNTSDGPLENLITEPEKSFFDPGVNPQKSSHCCRFLQSRKRLMCNGSIDYAYLNEIKSEQIIDFVVENYEADSLYKKKLWSNKNLETGEWYLKLPKLYQKLTGEVQLKDTGLQISVNARMIPWNSKGFSVEGEAFSNKIIKISWKLKGNLNLGVINEKTVISLDVGAVGDGEWRLQSNLTFLRRASENAADEWRVIGVIKSDYISENQFVVYKGNVWTEMVKEECKFSGNVKLQNINLEASLSGSVSPPQKKQITIPKSAFSNMNIKNIIFKDSNFYNDFDKSSFKGIRGLKRISFLESKLEVLPRLDELFQTFSDLEEIYFEDCTAPNLKFGVLSSLTNVRKLSFKGSGPLNFDDSSFLWLKKSNLTILNLRNSHVKISSSANSVLWSVNNTLKHLDISHSTINGEKDLLKILRNSNINGLMAEGLKLRKVPTNALEKIRKTLIYLSLRENDFRKNFEKHLFDSVFNFPLMLNLEELNLEECHINYLEKGTFDNLPNLKTLHLSYNNFQNIQDGWMYITPRVTYLSLRHNGFAPLPATGQDTEKPMNLSKFQNLEVLDLSDSIFTSMSKLTRGLGSNLKNLSLRNTGLEDLPDNFFENLTSLEVLDLSFNRNLKTVEFFSFNLFRNLKNLKSLDLKHCRIGDASVYQNALIENNDSNEFKLENLQFLDLSVNNIKILDPKIFKTFPNLKILNLSGNGITDWSTTVSFNKHLEALFLDENRIEEVTNNMLIDIKTLKHIKLGNNPFICGSYVYDIIKIVNSLVENHQQYTPVQGDTIIESNYSNVQESEFISEIFYKTKKNQEIRNMKILDWSDKNYICFSWSKSKFIPFTQVEEDFTDDPLKNSEKTEATLMGITIVIVVGIVVTVAILCWKFLDIHLITMAVRNAVALTSIGKNEKGSTVFRYNAFVSYSEKDRPWVIENLLPHLESRGEVKVCLHERDFQVGLSIIENILNSIDSSKNIILVVSQAFLKSQWCQYEMQLAQFRLLEKGRDQLILIFLENIPLVKRPKALRYLMMTKTYLEWPSSAKSLKEFDNFWSRLMKSVANLN